MKAIGWILVGVLCLTGTGTHSGQGVKPMEDGEFLVRTAQEYLDAFGAQPGRADDQKLRWNGQLAKASFVVGKSADAKKYAEEMLALLRKLPPAHLYGDAVQDANLVLGRIAVREGRIDEARRYLIASGSGPGSPVLDSFGPNVTLAKDLLEIGERDVVIRYLELVRRFWKKHDDPLEQWRQEIANGQIPDFGANLLY